MRMFETNHPPSMVLLAAVLISPGLWAAISQRSVGGIVGFGLAIAFLLGLAVRNAIRRYHKRHT